MALLAVPVAAVLLIVATTGLAARRAGRVTAFGIPLTHWLIGARGRSSGISAWLLAQGPSPVLPVPFGALVVLGAGAPAALPASRAACGRPADTVSAVA
ncbi:hypothetical protein ACWD5Q_20650 [Streptomyces sp. NPDC002513]